MRNVLARTDDYLIDCVFQPVVDSIADLQSLTCFQMARVCTSISAIAWIWSQQADLVTAARSGWVGLQIFQAVIFLLGLGAIMVLHTLFQKVGSLGLGQGRVNPLRMAMFIQRLIILLGLAGSCAKAALGVGSPALLTVTLSASAALYFGACSNPPPTRHRRTRTNQGRMLATVPISRRQFAASAARHDLVCAPGWRATEHAKEGAARQTEPCTKPSGWVNISATWY